MKSLVKLRPGRRRREGLSDMPPPRAESRSFRRKISENGSITGSDSTLGAAGLHEARRVLQPVDAASAVCSHGGSVGTARPGEIDERDVRKVRVGQRC